MSHILAGISWPFRIEDNGLPAPAKGTEVVRSALIMLMKTPKRSRVMRPTLGTGLNDIIFENQGPLLSSLVQRQIASAIADFLPQVRILDITTKEIGTTLAVNVQYSIQNVRDETGFVTISETGN
jgi:phage baseplate assembly protein W